MRAAALALLAAGCGTWGVEVVEREVKASHPADGIAAVTADLSVEDGITARAGGAAIDATASLVAWIEPGGSAALLDRVRIAMDRRDSTLVIEPDTKGAATEQIVLAGVDLLLPAALALDLEVSHGDVSVSQLDGAVRVAAPDSAVSLDRTTGPVDVSAREVTAVLAGGGSIATTGGGAVTVTLLGDDFDQLVVTTETGPVAIHLPADRGWDIELSTTGEATATVNLGGLSCGGAGGQPCDAVRFGEGGPLIRVESSGGAIAVDDVR